jgi:hypothetical protein
MDFLSAIVFRWQRYGDHVDRKYTETHQSEASGAKSLVSNHFQGNNDAVTMLMSITKAAKNTRYFVHIYQHGHYIYMQTT